jgi:hypothetical protein
MCPGRKLVMQRVSNAWKSHVHAVGILRNSYDDVVSEK